MAALAVLTAPAVASTGYRDAVLADGPRGYWRLGDPASPAVDASGHGLPGTYAGGVLLGVQGALPADPDTAARLDGVNDLVTMGDPVSGALDFGEGDFSVELWVKTALNGERTLAAKRGSGGGSWLLTVSDDSGHVGQIRAGLSDGVTGQQVYSTRAIDDGSWHHVVVVVDRDAALRFYVDGVAAGTAANPPRGSVSNTAAFQLGKVSSYGYLNGDLDEVAVYDAALSADQVAAHYGAAEPNLPPLITVVSGPPASTSSGDATFSFFPSEPADLECALDAGAFAPCVSPHGYSGLAEGSHVFRVRGIDLAGSTGPPTSYAWQVDTTPPLAPTITPPPPELSNDPDSTISFTGESGASFLCRLDGADFAACSSPFPYTGLVDGPHLFEVKALDAAGNEGPAAAAAWVLDTVDPASPLLNGAPPNPSDTGDAEFTFTLVEGIGFLCRLDGSVFAPCTSPQTYVGLPDARHVFDVRSVDEAGNGSEPVRFTWTIERGPPAPTVDSGPASLTTATSASLSFSDSAADVTFECRLDDVAFSPCASPQEFANLADGPHTFEVKAFYPAGYDSPETAHAWAVDTAAPSQPTITEGPPGSTTSADASFGFSDGGAPPVPVGGALPAPLPESTGATHYVSTTGSDTAPGTLEQPWRTIQKALNTLQPGERALVREGVYPQNLHLDEAGTAGAPISVESYPGERPVLRPNPASPSFPLRIASTGAYFRLRGFLIEDAQGATTAGIYISNTSHDIEISQNEIRGSDSHGILLDGDTARVQILANHIHDNGSLEGSAQDHGIYFQGTDHLAADNVIHDQPFGFGIQVFDENHGSIVAHNTIVRNGKSGIVLGGAVGVDDVQVIGNVLAYNSRYGLSYDAHPPTASRADHNLVFGNGDGGIEPGGTGIDLSGGNLEGDPRFVSLTQRDFRLLSDSAAIGAALADFSRPRDANGRSRVLGGLPDVGALETGVGFECSLDGAPFAACASPRDYQGLVEGAHSFSVRSVDDAGNPSAPTEAAWTVDTVAPSAEILAPPPDPDNDPSPTFAFAADELGASFECRLDIGVFLPCSSPHDYVDLTDGVRTFEVRATDLAGNRGPAAAYSWTLDTQAPPTPGIDSGPPALTNLRAADLAFSSSEPGVSLRCRLDDGAFADCASLVGYTGLGDGDHVFEVLARDAAGNESAAAEHSWTIDGTPPSAPSITGSPEALTRSTAASLAFSSLEPDVSFRCRLDGEDFAACTSPQDYAGLTDGPHTFEVTATDAAGNTSAASIAAWSVDTTAPDAPTIDEGPPALTSSRAADLVFSSTEPGASFRCSLDGAAFADCASPVAYAGLGDGDHVFAVATSDAAGNESGAATHSWTVDGTPPSTPTITSSPGAVTRSTAASVAFSSEEGGISFRCRLDEGAFAACTSPQDYAGLGDGPHTFEVDAVDAAGNPSAVAVATWSIDTVAPAAPTIESGPSPLVSSRAANLVFSGGEPGVSFRCRLDVGAVEDCASPAAYVDLVDGDHAFAVTALDAAGNESGAALHVWAVDATAPPAPAIVSAPPLSSDSNSASFTFTNDAAGVAFACRLDLGPFEDCSSPVDYQGLAAGAHTFAVKARDAAGNESTAASYAWTVTTGLSYSDVVLADGPGGYWRLGEVSGTAAADTSGFGNGGSFVGGVGLGVAGALAADPDPAAHFDGTNDLVTIGDPASGALDLGAADVSVELWARTAVHGERTLVGKRTSGPGWLVTVTDDPGHAGQVRATLNDGSVTRQAYSTGRIDDNAWHHVVVVFDRDAGIGFYLDGAASGFTAGAATGSVSNTAVFQVGKASGYGYFRGDLDEVAVYGAALSAARIQAHFDVG